MAYPVLIVEVLSQSTAASDRGENFFITANSTASRSIC